MVNQIKKYLSCPFVVLLILVTASIVSLAAAYTAQYAFGLEPCVLCLYQRIPFAIVIGLGLLGLAVRKKIFSLVMINFCGLAMLANSALALYHTGVEQKWWRSHLEACTIPSLEGDNPGSMLDSILKAPNVRCDEIAWQDPLLGLSMANYNIVFCFGLFVLCAASLWLSLRPKGSSAP